MIPYDAPPHDWSLYYNETYMTHKKLGPVHVVATSDNDGEPCLRYYQITREEVHGSSIPCKNVKDLRIFWPRPGAYNFTQYQIGVFVGRSPQRHMKRSAFRDHYYMLWSPMTLPGDTILRNICIPERYFDIDAARRMMTTDKKKWSSVALSHRIIVGNSGPINLEVVYNGEGIGIVGPSNILEPYMPDDSRLPRLRSHLKTVGIL